MNKTPFRYFKNKYVISVILFLAWITFFDRNDLISQYQLHKQRNQLRTDKEYFVSEIKKNNEYMKELQTNPDNLEKFAREKYLMKKDDEDIFVIVKPDTSRH